MPYNLPPLFCSLAYVVRVEVCLPSGDMSILGNIPCRDSTRMMNIFLWLQFLVGLFKSPPEERKHPFPLNEQVDFSLQRVSSIHSLLKKQWLKKEEKKRKKAVHTAKLGHKSENLPHFCGTLLVPLVTFVSSTSHPHTGIARRTVNKKGQTLPF